MANRYPLVINNSTTVVGELQSGDNLNLSLSGIYDGSSLGSSGQVLQSTGSGGVVWGTAGDVSTTATQTLSNKTLSSCTISGLSNTLTNIPIASLISSSITVNGNAISLGGSVTTPNATYTISTLLPQTNYATIKLTAGGSGGSDSEFNIYGSTNINVTRQTSGDIFISPNLNTLSFGSYINAAGSYNGTGDLTISINASSTNTASSIVARDASGNFAAGDITSGNITATSFIKSGGTASQFLKANGSVDSNTYLTSYTETDTLNSVTTRGNSTANNISVGTVTASSFVKSGGTSTQFLKADGSVDSTTYATQAFPSGTLMLFQQTTAPTGWTKQTTHNDKALRVVSGTASNGGTAAFSTVFTAKTPSGTVNVSGTNSGGGLANTTVTGSVSGTNSGGGVSNTTLAESQMPNHAHSMYYYDGAKGGNGSQGPPYYSNGQGRSQPTWSTFGAGGGGSHGHGFTNPSWSGSVSMNAHNHTFTQPTWSGSASFTGSILDFNVQYVDLIIASKN